MAKFKMELPTDIMKDFQRIYDNADEIFGEMTKAGAEVALNNIKATAPNAELASHAKLTRTYKTPSDQGIATKVYFSGYIPFKGNRRYFVRRGRKGGKVYRSTKGVPAEFLALVYEYGRSGAPFPKKPFIRKAFKKSQIESAMLEAQKRASGGLLDE